MYKMYRIYVAIECLSHDAHDPMKISMIKSKLNYMCYIDKPEQKKNKKMVRISIQIY